MILPTIMFAELMLPNMENKQREARALLRHIERTIQGSDAKERKPASKKGALDFEAVNRDILLCYRRGFWSGTERYIRILHFFRETMSLFMKGLPKSRRNAGIEKLHSEILSRFEFQKRRLQGIDSFSKITTRRLDIQQSLVGWSRTLKSSEADVKNS